MEPARVIAARARVPLLVLLTLLLHTTVLADVHPLDVRPDAMLLLAAVAGLAAGAEAGAIVGFVSGLGADLFLQTPLGLSALVFSLVGYATGALQAGIIRASWWIPPVTALLASAGGVVLFALAGVVVGQSQLFSPRLVMIAAGVGIMNAALCPVALRLVRWAIPPGLAQGALGR